MKSHDDDACLKDMRDTRTRRIRALNDRLRCEGRGGRWCITAGVENLGPDALSEIILMVAGFVSFDSANDPYGEHDFGWIVVCGEQLYWKIDYYDRRVALASPDPSDASVTTRVLTIMLAAEY